MVKKVEQEIRGDIEDLGCPCKSSLGMLLRKGNGSLVIKKNAGLNNKAHSPGTSTDRALPPKEAFRVWLSGGH